MTSFRKVKTALDIDAWGRIILVIFSADLSTAEGLRLTRLGVVCKGDYLTGKYFSENIIIKKLMLTKNMWNTIICI